MPAPDIILPKPYVLLSQAASSLGVIPLQGIMVGYVEVVYDTSDRVAVGQYVFYEVAKTSQFMYGSTIYYLIKDEFITGQEVSPP